MNRKETREQNDISNIIGNLPIRLQKKIAEEVASVGANNTTNSNVIVDNEVYPTNARSIQKKALTAKEQGNDAVPDIGFFLQKSGTTVESSLMADKDNTNSTVATTTMEEKQCESKSDVNVIPGILRLNLNEAVEQSKSTADTKVRENGRSKHGRQQRNRISIRPMLQESPTHRLQKITYPEWFDALDVPLAKELFNHYDSITALLQDNVLIENWSTFCNTRTQLQTIFMQMLLYHLKFCCEQKVDTFFWKLLFYNVREQLKNVKSPEASTLMLTLIDEGFEFYTNLYAKLNAKYLARFQETSSSSSTSYTCHKFEFIAKVAAQKLLICLGDLCRYKVKQLQEHDYTEAAAYYQQAQRLIPTNGIPYNQLAILAIYARKKFDAIYFHMRSLMSSNAIYSAKESLLVLFDEIRKKYEETELKVSPVHRYTNNSGNNGTFNSKAMRKEVWIYPDGIRRLHRSNVNANKSTITQENRFNDLPTDELLRRFTSLYLYLIGKFYMGIGMDAIQEHQRKMLMQLNVILDLSDSSLVISRSRILKMIALNIFIMEHNMHKESRREIRYYAFNFCNEIFGLILRKCNQMLTEYIEKMDDLPENSFFTLNTILQYIKIYTDWLAQNVDIWEPVRSEEHTFIYCWTELVHLFSHIQRVREQFVSNCDAQQNVVLYEDQFLNGFTPLATPSSSSSSSSSLASLKQQNDVASTEVAQFEVRIAKIEAFQKCFEDNRKLLDICNVSNFVEEELNIAQKNAFDSFENNNNDDDDIEDDNSENIVANDNAKLESNSKSMISTNSENAQMTQLLKLKIELEAKTNFKKLYNAKLDEILKYVDTKMYIEVRPKFLLPDTNCFIDCLEDFERLSMEFKCYTLIIPLTVVKELDGLSKGVKLESYEKSLQMQRIHHFDDVSTRAKKSLDFIRTTKNVKCATTKGSIINASLFALVEEEHVSNDDKILATALALSKTMSSENSKDGKCFIQTELVLITTDRNLRVKALSRNLAVSELSEFLQWAKDCNT